MATTTTEAQPLDFDSLKNLPRAERWERFGPKVMVPIDHPLLPPPGPDFARTAADMSKLKIVAGMPRDSYGEIAVDLLYRKALYKRYWQIQVGFKSKLVAASFLPGGFWELPPIFDVINNGLEARDRDWTGYRKVSGPRAGADVMLIGKHPGNEEIHRGQNFVGKTSADLHRALRAIGISREEKAGWYVTNAVKHNRLDPTSGTMQQAWLKNCAPLLWEEILLVRPRCILCLGTEAIKMVMGKDYTVTNAAGRVVESILRFPPAGAATHAEFDDLDRYEDHAVLIMGIPHPAYVERQREAYQDFLGRLEKFVELTRGVRPPDVEKDAVHVAFHVPRPLGRAADEVIEKAHAEWDFEAYGALPIAWDAEWHGRQPGDAESYLRTIQFATAEMCLDKEEEGKGKKKDPDHAKYDAYPGAPKKATCIVLTEKGGGEGWFPAREEVAGVIQRLLEGRHSDGKLRIATRHGGHFFKADIPWIRRFLGVDFRPAWAPPAPVPAPGPGDPPRPKRFDGHAYRLEYVLWNGRRQDAFNAGKRFNESMPDRREERFWCVIEPWDLTRYEGGFDTGYMTHAVFEAMESFNLEHVAMRWTTCPRWDTDVEKAKKRIAQEMGIKARELLGYGDIQDHEILPYACYDGDATMRLFCRLNYARSRCEGEGFLDHDVYHNSSREGFWRTMLAGLTFLEMEESGVTVDVGRGKELIKTFELVKERLTQSLRAELGWPAFNPNSPQQVRAWMFGEKYSGAIDKKTGEIRPLLPTGLVSLKKVPIKTTGKPSKAWGQIKDQETAHLTYTAAVDKEVLGIYATHDKRIKKLRDIRFVRQVLQTVLRPPKVGDVVGADAEGMAYDEMDEFDGGFLSYVSPRDSRVRSRFYPVETGRCSSAGPNLQNLAKRREDDYARIQGHYDEDGKPKGDYLDIFEKPLYDNPIRSIVTAGMWDGEPTVLLEFDIVSAEIAALAWESGDAQMIEDVNRNMLKESDPHYLDLHGSTAVEAFKLTCAPTKKGLKSIGKPGLRTAAKNVRFGVPYGRSAEALSRQCREEGADVSPADCQRLIDNYESRYPDAWDFLMDCESRPGSDRPYIVGAFGRMRRFQPVDDPSILAEQGRSAKNYPIQNLVADAIMLGMYNLRQVREEMGLQDAFRVVLQIHDAVILEVKIPYIDAVINKVIPKAMQTLLPIMPRTLNGTPFDRLDKLTEKDENYKDRERYGHLQLTAPYRFEVDSTVFLNWGQAIEPARGKALGIPEQYLGGKQ